METEFRRYPKPKYIDWTSHYSPVTDRLIKRKHILEFSGGKPEEWLVLANDFLADGGRLNHAYCMAEYKKAGGIIEPKPEIETEEIPEPEYREWTDQ